MRRQRRPRSLANFPLHHLGITPYKSEDRCYLRPLYYSPRYMIVTKKKDFITIKNEGRLRCRFPSRPSVVLKILQGLPVLVFIVWFHMRQDLQESDAHPGQLNPAPWPSARLRTCDSRQPVSNTGSPGKIDASTTKQTGLVGEELVSV